MDLDKITEFLKNHIEKIILAIIGMIAGYLLVQGVNKPSYLTKNRPDELTQNANRVKLDIDKDHTARIFEDEERQPTSEVLKRTADLFKPIDAPVYKPRVTWSGGVEGGSVVRRQDPMLAPILDLKTYGVACAISLNGAREPGGYPLAQLEDADPVKKKEKRKPKKKRKPNPMEEMMMMGMDGPSPDEMGMSSMEATTAAPKVRKLDSDLDLGFKSKAESSTNNPQPRMAWFIAGTALLPHKEIYEAFELALENADGYKTTRDVPIYFDFEVQRADVTGKTVDDLVEADWKDVYNRLLYVKLAARIWNGYAPELVPEDYRDENLTMWIPPVLLDDYSDFSLHPEIPMISRQEIKNRERKENANVEDDTIDVDDFNFDDDDQVLTGPAGAGRAAGMQQMDDMTRAMMSGGGMRMFGAQGKVDANPVDHKLIRFYDFFSLKRGLRPGNTYVYRVRYSVIDPNYPPLPQSQPKLGSLIPDVVERVSKKMAETRESGTRDFNLWSEWSAPSPPSKLPTLSGLYSGKIETGSFNRVQIGGEQTTIPRDTPSAKVVLTDLDEAYGTRIPMLVENVREGAVLASGPGVAEVVDPISLEIKKLPDYRINAGTSVIDLGGGVPLAVDDELSSPGTMLLYDSNGDLIVTDDISDQFKYRIYSYADEKGE